MQRNIAVMVMMLMYIGMVSLSEAVMMNCGSTCSKGFVYLSIPADLVTANKDAIDVVQSENDAAVTIFSVKVLANKEIVINVKLNSIDDSADGLAVTVNTNLKPTYVRLNEQQPLVLYFNDTAVCVLFENECLSECSRLPSVITSLSGFLKSDATITLDKSIAFTNNRTSLLMSTENCKQVLFAEDITYYNSFKIRINSVFKSFYEVLREFGLFSSDFFHSSLTTIQTTVLASTTISQLENTTTTTATIPTTTTTTPTTTTTTTIYQIPTKEILTLTGTIRSQLAILQNGDLATAGLGNTVKIWNLTDGSLKNTFYGHANEVMALATLRNGNLVSGSYDKTIKIWNKDGDLLRTLTNHTNLVYSLAVFQNGNFASASVDKRIIIWSQDGTLITILVENTVYYVSVIVLPNDDLVSGSNDGSIKIWSSDGTLKKSIQAHSNYVYSVAHLQNGDLASCSLDATIKIWSIDGQLKNTFRIHTGTSTVFDIVELPNGDLASASLDRTIKIFNSVTGQVKITLTGHSNWIWKLKVLPNGELASSSEDGTVKIWSP